MDLFIEQLGQKIVEDYIKYEISNSKRIVDLVLEEANNIKSERDKIDFFSTILEGNEKALQLHLSECLTPNCDDKMNHDRVSYFLQQELAILGVNANQDYFTSEEKENFNHFIDTIIEQINLSNQLMTEQFEILSNELNELKQLHVFGKKNCKQNLLGKFSEMTFSGIITEISAKPIIENIVAPGYKYLLDSVK